MKGLKETRIADLELRADGAKSGKLVGRAAVFNRETNIGGLFREVIRPGAFKKTLQERNVKMLWNHDPSYPMGSTKGGTLKLRESDEGLEVENDPPTEPPYGGFRQNIERGDVSQMSFGFEVIKEQRNEPTEDEPLPLREVLEVRLFEVSPVTFPAYEDTEIEARARQVVESWASDDSNAAEDAAQVTDEVQAEKRTTPEPVPNANHSVAGRLTTAHVLRRSELLAAEEELLSYEQTSGVAGVA